MVTQITRFTVDVETDFGGRSRETSGISQGIPVILDLLKKARLTGLFFISGEVLALEEETISWISKAGHRIGAHGYYHERFKAPWRAEHDKEVSKAMLNTELYRAPKFYHARQDNIYSNPKGHVGLLKHTWFGTPLNENSIFYMHPFDIVRTKERPPNLFCAVWYAHPELALKNLRNIVENMSRKSPKHP